MNPFQEEKASSGGFDPEGEGTCDDPFFLKQVKLIDVKHLQEF